MFKSRILGACLVCMAVLIIAGAVSAGTGGRSGSVLARQPADFGLLAMPAINSLQQPLNNSASPLPVISFSTTISRWQDDDDKDKDDKPGDPPPAPTPEPTTLLSFGTALAIGGGVFLLGRLRKERK